jgi:hypothetical protein
MAFEDGIALTRSRLEETNRPRTVTRLLACAVNPALSRQVIANSMDDVQSMMDKLVAADHVADQRLIRLAVRWLGH